MFGTRDDFDYLECGLCGCIQILVIPPNLGDYYRKDYYAFRSIRHSGRIRTFFRMVWASHHLYKPNIIGFLLTLIYGEADFFKWVKSSGLTFTSSILDVGSGNGGLLVGMSTCGFVDLTGVDPFIESDMTHPRGVRILKRDVADIEGQYDLVMSHHSIEHVPDPIQFLKELRRLVKPTGTVLVRTPLASSWAWEHYGTDWVALDAPRHLFIQTDRSMRIVAEKAGLAIERVVWDSTAFSIWASELYRRDIPLNHAAFGAQKAIEAIFSRTDLRRFSRMAAKLNSERRGDAAAFYLKQRDA